MSHAWMPFYVGDYLGKTQRLTTAEHGAYLLLIMEYWQSGRLPNDDGQLARICRLTLKEWQRIRETIAAFFQPDWHHDRVEEEIAKADAISSAKSDAGKAGAAARWQNNKPDDGSRIADALPDASQTQWQIDAPSPSPSPVSKSLPSEAPSDKPKTDDVREAVAIYARVSLRDETGWPGVQRLTSPRIAACRARLAEVGGIEGWRGAMDRAGRSAFLCGRNEKGWRADFDFFCQSKSFTKLMEGSYDDHAGSSASSGRPHDAILGALAKAAIEGPGMGERGAAPDVRGNGFAAPAEGDREPYRDLEGADFMRRP